MVAMVNTENLPPSVRRTIEQQNITNPPVTITVSSGGRYVGQTIKQKLVRAEYEAGQSFKGTPGTKVVEKSPYIATDPTANYVLYGRGLDVKQTAPSLREKERDIEQRYKAKGTGSEIQLTSYQERIRETLEKQGYKTTVTGTRTYPRLIYKRAGLRGAISPTGTAVEERGRFSAELKPEFAPSPQEQRQREYLEQERKKAIQASYGKPTPEGAISEYKPGITEQLQRKATEQERKKGFLSFGESVGLTAMGYGYQYLKGKIKGVTAFFRPEFYRKEVPTFLTGAATAVKEPQLIGEGLRQAETSNILYGMGFVGGLKDISGFATSIAMHPPEMMKIYSSDPNIAPIPYVQYPSFDTFFVKGTAPSVYGGMTLGTAETNLLTYTGTGNLPAATDTGFTLQPSGAELKAAIGGGIDVKPIIAPGQKTLFGKPAKPIKPETNVIVRSPTGQEISIVRYKVEGVRPIFYEKGTAIKKFVSLEEPQDKLSKYGITRGKKYTAFDVLVGKPVTIAEKDITVTDTGVFVKGGEAERFIKWREQSLEEKSFRRAEAGRMIRYQTPREKQLALKSHPKEMAKTSLFVKKMQDNILAKKKEDIEWEKKFMKENKQSAKTNRQILKQAIKKQAVAKKAELYSGSVSVRPVYGETQGLPYYSEEEIVYGYGKQLPSRRLGKGDVSVLRDNFLVNGQYGQMPLIGSRIGSAEALGMTQMPLTQNILKQNQLQRAAVKPKTKLDVKAKIRQGIRQKPIVEPLYKQDIVPVVRTDVVTKTDLLQMQKAEQIFSPLTQTYPKPIITELPPSTPPPPPPPPPPNKELQRLQQQIAKEDPRKGYDVYVKRRQLKRGKGAYLSRGYQKVNKKPVSKAAAYNRMASIVDKYSNRSGMIKPARRLKTPSREKLNIALMRKFRLAKKNLNQLVERSRYAIDSYFEKQDIPYEAARLRRGGKPKANKVNVGWLK